MKAIKCIDEKLRQEDPHAEEHEQRQKAAFDAWQRVIKIWRKDKEAEGVVELKIQVTKKAAELLFHDICGLLPWQSVDMKDAEALQYVQERIGIVVQEMEMEDYFAQ